MIIVVIIILTSSYLVTVPDTPVVQNATTLIQNGSSFGNINVKWKVGNRPGPRSRSQDVFC